MENEAGKQIVLNYSGELKHFQWTYLSEKSLDEGIIEIIKTTFYLLR